jgi:hypothetical protein
MKRIRDSLAGVPCCLPHRLWTDARCLFVLSTGRTGTATLAKLLALAPQVRAFHEPRPELLAERKAAFAGVWSDFERFWKIFSRARCLRLALARRRAVYAETSARMTFFAPVIAEYMPNARFLYVYRHPGDVVRSGMGRGWYDSHPLDAVRIEPTKDDPAYAKWRSWGRFAKICWYWDAYNRFALRFLDCVDRGRVLLSSSEDLLDPLTGCYHELFQLIAVPSPPEDAVHEVLSVRHNYQRYNDFPRFEQWTAEQRQTLYRIAGPTMTRLGYAKPADLASTRRMAA